jgi:hypothetical protein
VVVGEGDGTGSRDPFTERAQALRAVESDYPGWACWPGVASLLCARRPRASPPLVVRSTTESGPRKAIENAERERGLR